MLGTKGVEAADKAAWVVTGIDCRLGDGLATDKLLNTAETPSPNSRSGDMLRGVFQTTPPEPGRGTVEGWTMVDKLTFSTTLRELSVRSRNS